MMIVKITYREKLSQYHILRISGCKYSYDSTDEYNISLKEYHSQEMNKMENIKINWHGLRK